MPMLIKTVQMTDGDVIEYGSGYFSTPLLHWLLAGTGRKLKTYESVPEYYSFAKNFRSRTHSIVLIDDWDKIEVKGHPSVVFIDHVTDRRAVDALRWKDSADYIVLHDSETDTYKYSTVYPQFRWRYDWRFCNPYTTVLSNFKDLRKLYER